MNVKTVGSFLAPVLVAAFVALTPSLSTGADPEKSARHGQLHLRKECSQFTGLPGGFCTFTSSNLEQLKVGSRVYYDQAAGVPDGLLDSNVILDAGNGNRAIGRCTLDVVTNHGLCTFSDGIGDFAGFEARVDVFCPGTGVVCTWDGRYKFSPKLPR
jgi:hypothetical protein